MILNWSICFLSLVSFITLLTYDQGDETGQLQVLHRKRKESTPPFPFVVIAGGLYIMVCVLCRVLCFALADRSSAFPPPLLLQQLDAVVDVKLDGPPVSLVAHQQGAEFEAALAVRLRGDSQLHKVSL